MKSNTIALPATMVLTMFCLSLLLSPRSLAQSSQNLGGQRTQIASASQPVSSNRSIYTEDWLKGDSTGMGLAAGSGIQRPVSGASFGTSPFSRLAIGVNAGTLGLGVEVAVPLASRLNLRAGGNFFDYTTTTTQSGITYDATVSMRSAQTSVDWFPFRSSFHISPGAMFYNGNNGGAKVVLPSGQSITINHMDYYSDPADPLHGSAKVIFPKAAPQLTVGFGNMISRREGNHFSVPFDVGFVYFGTGTATLDFAGSACVKQDGALFCQKTSAYPEFQQNVLAEQQKIQSNLDYVRFYPVVRVGMMYKF